MTTMMRPTASTWNVEDHHRRRHPCCTRHHSARRQHQSAQLDRPVLRPRRPQEVVVASTYSPSRRPSLWRQRRRRCASGHRRRHRHHRRRSASCFTTGPVYAVSARRRPRPVRLVRQAGSTHHRRAATTCRDSRWMSRRLDSHRIRCVKVSAYTR